MHRSLTLLLATTATTLAQIPADLPFKTLVQQYLPFISTNTEYILNDTIASGQLANALKDPVTIFLTLNTPFEQFLATPPSSPAAGAIEAASAASAALNSDLFQYLQVDGLHPSTSFNGTTFLTTRLTAPPFNLTSQGNKIEVFRNGTAFYVGTAIGFKSNVLIPDINFLGGILHIVDHPCAPPYTLSDTATVLNISILTSMLQQPYPIHPTLDNFDTLTIFAVQNSAAAQLVPPLESDNSSSSSDTLADYIIPGVAYYSTNLTVGANRLGTFIPPAGNPSLESSDEGGVSFGNADGLDVQVVGDEIYVNGSRILERDILVRNGVVHIIDAPFRPML